MKRGVWYVAVIGLLSCIAIGGEMTGKALLAQLDSKEQCDKDAARGFITGSYIGHSGQSMAVDRAFDERLAAAVKKFLEEHPDRLNQSATKLLDDLFEQDSFKKEFPSKTVQTESGAQKP